MTRPIEIGKDAGVSVPPIRSSLINVNVPGTELQNCQADCGGFIKVPGTALQN